MNIYEINKFTMALIPCDSKRTKVYETNDTFIISNPIMKIIEESCKSFGSSYLGRHEGTKKLTGISHKSPIIIEETNGIIFFPTTSPRLDTCCWISLKYIKKYYSSNNKTIVIFENNKHIELNISINSFDNQYLRATKLEYELRKKFFV